MYYYDDLEDQLDYLKILSSVVVMGGRPFDGICHLSFLEVLFYLLSTSKVGLESSFESVFKISMLCSS